jgi:NAD(P)-dependent dehydrogenase (short-subunit alcohol dehydrogenase family)
VTQPDALERCVARCARELGPVKVLVNAAQSPSYRSSALLDVSSDTLDQLWRSGPLATLALMRLCHPQLRGGGSIVNFGSGAQFTPARYGAYAAAKAAIGMLTRAAAEEWGPDGIRANLVVPFAESPAFYEDFGGKTERLAASVRRIPLRRVGDPEKDVGRVVVFLASDDSAYVTGTTLMVEGGSHFLR